MNAVKEIRDSELFQEFLLSGVHVLQDARIVSNKSKQQSHRWSLLGKNTTTIEDHPAVILIITMTYSISSLIY